MTEPKSSEGLDTAAIDDGWGDDPEPAAAPPPAKPSASALGASPVAAPAPELPPDDEIEFDADSVTRDSMPTFQHPNPLEFDRDPDAAKPAVPKPPRLPKLPRR